MRAIFFTFLLHCLCSSLLASFEGWPVEFQILQNRNKGHLGCLYEMGVSDYRRMASQFAIRVNSQIKVVTKEIGDHSLVYKAETLPDGRTRFLVMERKTQSQAPWQIMMFIEVSRNMLPRDVTTAQKFVNKLSRGKLIRFGYWVNDIREYEPRQEDFANNWIRNYEGLGVSGPTEYRESLDRWLSEEVTLYTVSIRTDYGFTILNLKTGQYCELNPADKTIGSYLYLPERKFHNLDPPLEAFFRRLPFAR